MQKSKQMSATAQHTQKVINAYCCSKNKIYNNNNNNNNMQHCTTKMFQHDCNVILYNSGSINKKLKLSHLYFRYNVDCFCLISLMKIIPIKATAELFCVSEQHSSVSFLNESTFLNESSESMIQ